MTDTTVGDEAMKWTVLGFLIIWSLIVLGSLSMFYRSKATLPIRTRGLSLTILLTLTQYLMVVWIILQPILNLPCTLTLWMTGLLLPLWSATLLARFLRIMYLHRINQFNLSNSLLDIANNDYKKSSSTNFDSVLKPVTSGGRSSKNFPNLDSWLLRNRGWFGSKGLTIVLFAWLFFHIVITLMIQVVSTYIKSDINECIRLWQLYPSLFITLLTLMLEWPVFIVLFRDMHESFGIKLELVVNLFLAPAFLICQVVSLVLYNFNPTILMILKFVATIFVCFMHLLSVGYPLWWARHEFVLFEKVKSLYASKELQRKQLLDDYKAANSNINNKNNTTSNTNVTATTKTNNKPTLECVLENKLLFADFKMFAAHNFCVENVLFYERYTLFKKWEEMEAARNEGRIVVKVTNQQSTLPCNTTPLFINEAETKEFNDNIPTSTTLSIYETSSIPLEALYETQYLDIINCRTSQTLTPSDPNQYYHNNQQPSYTRQSYTNQTRINDPIINCATAQTPIQSEILNLYNDFIAPESSLQLNLAGNLKKQLTEQLKKGIFSSEIYLPVYNEVYFLLSQDVFPRYLKSLEKSNN